MACAGAAGTTGWARDGERHVEEHDAFVCPLLDISVAKVHTLALVLHFKEDALY
jgi:hypothetical protein